MTDEIPTASPGEQPFEPSNYSIQIHNILHTAQQSHGLNNDSDYASYRTYLTNRISRLRHSKAVYKRTGGSGGGTKKHAFRKREYTLEEANEHENFILISIYTVERAWAHAMEIKETANSNGGHSHSNGRVGKKNYHVKRLKKSVKHLEELECFKEICDESTRLEMECYAAYMRGNHFCEKKDWKVSGSFVCGLVGRFAECTFTFLHYHIIIFNLCFTHLCISCSNFQPSCNRMHADNTRRR